MNQGCSSGCGNTTPGDFESNEMDRAIESTLSKIGRKIVVMSGKGGVGKSTISAYMALKLSHKGYKVGLMDVDLHGPSIPRLLHVESGFDLPGNGIVRPYKYSENLSIASIEMMFGDDKDTAVIWRGPMKISAIRQFMSDLEWGDLDFLIVDAPPGTGDEPLTVSQTIQDAEALIVTTSQEISQADVRKSINFCRQVEMKILGVVENMSGLLCPHCGEKIDVFGSGGGEKLSERMNVRLLGKIPLDSAIGEMGDRGALDTFMDKTDLLINKAFDHLVATVLRN